MSAPRKTLIFDFDGTLADSAPVILAIYTDLAEKNKWRPMTDEDYKRLRRGSLRDARKWAGIHWWQFPLILRSAKKIMHVEAEKVHLFPEISELIHELHEMGHDLYILSRNSHNTVDHVLHRYKLSGKVRILDRRKRSFGSKAAAIRRLLKEKGYDKENVYMIGDEVRDVEAAKVAGINSIAVSWGLQDQSILRKTNPSYLVQNVDELRETLQA